ncbi:MAG: tetratricopeptide repeat protein [Candidatus Firestonebacteria bacterium]|nr:tetratricopeptide repeat protein [Candidatus Firestonebacteria bacterium]
MNIKNNKKYKFIWILLIITVFFVIKDVESTTVKIENWHDNNVERKTNILLNNIGEMILKATNIPESVNKRATCGNCHEGELILKAEEKHKEHTILVPTNKTISVNLMSRKNGGKIEYITSEYAKDFSNGPYQAAFINDGITDSRRNPLFGNQPSFWGCDMLTKWKEPFPQEFIYSFKDNSKYLIDTFILYNGAGGDGDGFDSEVKNFSLYLNSDPVIPADIYNVTDDGGGWSYNNGKFGYLSPNNILGDGIFPSFQQSDKFENETWIQSKNLEYTINTTNPKWIRIDFKKPTTISSIFIVSDDSANVHNMETDIYKLKIVAITPSGEKVIYDNSKNQIVEDEFAKGHSAYFDPIEATGVIFKFYTEKYVEWQRILIFKKPWKKVLSARAMQKYKDYSPEIFYFTPAEGQYLRVSIESNYGNPKWVDIGEMEVFNSYPKNLALYENGGRILDCSRVDDYVYGPNRLLDGKLLGDDEYSINKKSYVFGYEFQMGKKKLDEENDIKVILDLGKETVFGQINHYNTGDSGAKNVMIEYSLDNKTWEELGFCTKLNFSERDLPNKDIFIFSPLRARYIKFRYRPESWIKSKLRISEYEVFEVNPQYTKEGSFNTKVFDLKAMSLFEKIAVNGDGMGKLPLNTEIKITMTTDKVPEFTVDRHVSVYTIKPNEPNYFNVSEVHNGDRFYNYKVEMSTKDISVTPILNNIILEYRDIDGVLLEAKTYEENKSFNQAQEIYERIKAGKYDPDFTLKAEQGLGRIKNTINSEAAKLLEEGNKLFIREQYDDSIEIYRKILLQFPEARMDEVVRARINDAKIGKEYSMAVSLSEKKKYWKAIEQYRAIIDSYPGTEWANKAKKALDDYYEMEAQDMLDNAQRLFNNKQFEESQILFQQIKEKYTGWKWQQAANDGIKQCTKGKADRVLQEAQTLARKGNYDEAKALFRQIITEYSDVVDVKAVREEIFKAE